MGMRQSLVSLLRRRRTLKIEWRPEKVRRGRCLRSGRARARGVAGPHDPFSGRLEGVVVAVVWEMTN